MLKGKLNALTTSILTSVFLIGCGGGSSNQTQQDEDTTAPTLELIGSSEITIAQGSNYTDQGATSDDGIISVVGEVDTSIINSYTITYSAVDDAGNEATPITRTIKVTDQTPPIITLSGEPVVKMVLGEEYTDAGAVFEDDNIDGSTFIETTDTVNTMRFGSYELKYVAVDDAGNTAEAKRIVEVRPYDLYDFYKNGEVLAGGIDIFSEDNTRQSRGFRFTQSQFVVRDETNWSDNQFYIENGDWKLLDDSLFFRVTPDGITSYEGSFLTTQTSIEDLTNQTIKPIIDLDSEEEVGIEVLMPEGAQLITTNTTLLKDHYGIEERVVPNGVNLGREYFQSLAEFIQFQCGSDYFELSPFDGVYNVAFTCGQESQLSGTLVGKEEENGSIIENFGTWEIKTIPNTTIQALYLTLNNSPYPVPSFFFAMKEGEVWEGYYLPVSASELFTAESAQYQLYNKTVFDAVEQKLSEIQ